MVYVILKKFYCIYTESEVWHNDAYNALLFSIFNFDVIAAYSCSIKRNIDCAHIFFVFVE